MEVIFKPMFFRQLKKFPPLLQEEVLEKLDLFENPENHQQLRVHKLQGRMRNCWSFSVNYEYRIVFEWEKRNTSAIILAIGTHKIYE